MWLRILNWLERAWPSKLCSGWMSCSPSFAEMGRYLDIATGVGYQAVVAACVATTVYAGDQIGTFEVREEAPPPVARESGAEPGAPERGSHRGASRPRGD